MEGQGRPRCPAQPMAHQQAERCNALIVSVVAAVMAGLVIPMTPLAADLGFVPLPPASFVFLTAATATYLLLVELVKHRFMDSEAATQPIPAPANSWA